jgi:hypothetical protein
VTIAGITETMERAIQARRELIATLPCASCEVDSEAAQACRVFDQGGCKHIPTLEARRAQEERARNRRDNLLRAGLDASVIEEDERLQMVLRETIEPWKAVHAVRRALASKALRFLVLGGDHRSGKTLALIYACALRSDAVYIPAQRLAKIDQDNERWVSCKLLCVNELGREHLGKGYTASNLDELMAEREYGGKLTIFATNLPLRKKNPNDLPALADRYGDLFASRLEARNKIGAYVVCEPGAMEAVTTLGTPTNPQPFNERGER